MLSFAAKLYLKLKYELIMRAVEDPHYTQNSQLSFILQEMASTAFGVDHKILSYDTYEEFKSKVPVRTYEELVPYIERMLTGESNVLWHGMVRMFAKSSGTTNAASKYLPVSTEAYTGGHSKGIEDMLALYANAYPETEVFDGKSIGITGSLVTNDKGIVIGDISALICHESPWWTELVRVPTREVALGKDWNEKSSIIAETCSDEDVRMLAGVPTWISVILDKVRKKKNSEDFWPNLEFIAHGGVAFEPYRKLLEHYLPNRDIHYWQSYNASEGYFATQDRADADDMLLLLGNGVFYEFIPLSDYQSSNFEKIIPLSKVVLDQEYALIITTNSGLMRYSIGDTIKFTSLKPYRIVVTGRTKFFLNAFGEEIVVDNTNKALANAQAKVGGVVKHYTVAPVFMDMGSSGHHSWYVEFETEPASCDKFIESVDDMLKEINSDYKAKRNGSTILGMPTIEVVPSGTFEKWLKSKNKLGHQNKIPPLSKDATIIKELEEIIQT
ncbi:MAG: GH3 auxin-responsive promoter family protein [Candidatus Nomurabacteria bacterium]|nr:GH3 auxin-responsive promoter family protein [Candidatus Nomurabacteria bacterium]